MTCIVGLELGDGRVLFGADSMVSIDDCYDIHARPKIAERGGVVLGCAGCSYLCDLVTYSAKLPRPPAKGRSVHAWVIGVLLPEVCEAVRKGSRPKKDDEDPDYVELLLGVGGEIYHVMPTQRVALRSQHGFMAIGNGSEVALGSLHSTALVEGFVPDPRDRVEMAIQAAASRCLGVGGPIVTLEGSGVSRSPATARKGKASGKASGGGKVGRRAPKAGKRRG